ncbi:hypothetical protein QTN47_25585 [Danxiaibacter flavus]|uniref:Uncharacterized protein n=1 Tax=Danxiaibacter flavus TaxID=3049108 RepID=A0ABV3ZM60_9BACT|nr:hypothetical protein QNM32_25585 [Chitinophagaceae bacterium DXS]
MNNRTVENDEQPGSLLMPQIKINQLKYEIDMWKRLLAFMMDENIFLKNRLIEILKGSFNNVNISNIEDFQNCFVKKDETINVLRNDLAEIDKLIFADIDFDNTANTNIHNKLENIRKHISLLEKEFSQLKIEFNRYLLNNVYS